MNRLGGLIGAMFALGAMQGMPEVPISIAGGERKPAKRAGKAEILFDSRQQRRARERDKPIAVAKKCYRLGGRGK